MNELRGGRDLARETGWLDRFLFVYYIVLIGCCLAGSGPLRTAAISAVACLLVLHTTVVLAVRSNLLGDGTAAGLVYRLGVYGCFQSSYFALRWVLPTARSVMLDESLLRLDLHLFHVEPAQWFDQFVNPHTTEWFAFFYFSYFFLLASFVLPILFLNRDMSLLSEFALSIIMMFGFAHIIYIMVPGFGPWWYMKFEHPLPHGRFMDLVLSAVHAGGAQKDIFPSLHTGAPTFLTLFAFRNRARVPFKYVWPVMAFFTLNIIIATMFLRWHYLIDIFAGLALATTAWHFGALIARTEIARRAAQGRPHPWPALLRPEPEEAPAEMPVAIANWSRGKEQER